jgi:hypothetical protein
MNCILATQKDTASNLERFTVADSSTFSSRSRALRSRDLIIPPLGGYPSGDVIVLAVA